MRPSDLPIGLLVNQRAYEVQGKMDLTWEQRSKKQKDIKLFVGDMTKIRRNARISNYEIYDDRQRKLLDLCVQVGFNIQEWAKEGKNLFLYGSTGTGKDHCCVALLKHAISNLYSARWIDCQAILYPSVQAGQSIEGELMHTKIVCLSDPVLPGTTDANRKCLFRLINRRWSHGLATWVTCNLPENMRGAEELFGKQVFSRLMDRATPLYCGWEDIRKRRTRKA